MQIYEPQEDSYLLQKYVRAYTCGRVLDMGTGSGIQALTAMENPDVLDVVAVDINDEAVQSLQDKIKKEKLRKISVLHSDLFEEVFGKFNFIIFNPPYLPQDKGIWDQALYGGKKGWEVSEKFFREASKFLAHDGAILFLFSSLTNKDKIDEMIRRNLFQSKLLETKKIPFEELYVYEVSKTPLLRELEGRGIENIHYFAEGKRGVIYTGIQDRSKLVKTHFPSQKDIIKVAIKVKKEESKAEGRIQNETEWLKRLNKENIGPKLLIENKDYLVYKFVEGQFILDWIEKHDKDQIKSVITDLLYQCYTLDRLNINKEEMHHPLKHIIIAENNPLSDHNCSSSHPILIDFERCHETDKPHNVTQFIEFICRMEKELKSKGFSIDVDELRELAKEYKDTYDLKVFEEVVRKIQ